LQGTAFSKAMATFQNASALNNVLRPYQNLIDFKFWYTKRMPFAFDLHPKKPNNDRLRFYNKGFLRLLF
jgi:hypothetical protein